MYKIIGADGKEYGPVGVDALRQWIAEGRADARTRVLAEGSAEWRPLSEVPELAAFLPASPTAPAADASVPSLPPRNNPLAITGFVLGIAALPCLCGCYGLPFNLLGIIFSAIGLSQINRDPATQKGRGLAIAGLVLSILSILLAVLLAALGLALSSSDFWQHIQRAIQSSS
jgi:hypothetical protein